MSQIEHRTLLDLRSGHDFLKRHIGPSDRDVSNMLKTLDVEDLNTLIDLTVPKSIRNETTRALDKPINEHQALKELKRIAQKNQLYKNYLGQGYSGTHVPNVILRNVLENPGWYTAYTPYQPEIAQGRLEGLLNFQQMVIELTGMELANASMLDEATAAAEAMAMAKRVLRKSQSNQFFVDKYSHPQTLAVLGTRAEHFGFELIITLIKLYRREGSRKIGLTSCCRRHPKPR